MPNVIDYHYHSIWKDQIDYIKYYNGITYSHTVDHIYDSSGNLESTSDSRQSGNNLELTYEGRTLINYHVPMGAYGRDVDFKYNDSGYRTRKVSTGYMMPTITTDYYLEGSKVIHETDGTNNIYYNYDADGSLISMFYNSVEYFYVYNVLGDVIKLLDTNGDIVVEYSYDAWGNITYQTPNETIATANPYRYRGYRYDEETNLYYLNSRYYNPETGRFLNADGILDTGGVLGKNMYAYTYNNPVMFVDPSGYEGCSLALNAQEVYAMKSECINANSGSIFAVPLYGGVNNKSGTGTITIPHLGITTLAKPRTVDLDMDQVNRYVGIGVLPNTKSKKLENYIVYELFSDDNMDNVIYVGITNNYNKRHAQHTKSGMFPEGFVMETVYRHKTKGQALVIETALIAMYTIKDLQNRIFSVSKNRVDIPFMVTQVLIGSTVGAD